MASNNKRAKQTQRTQSRVRAQPGQPGDSDNDAPGSPNAMISQVQSQLRLQREQIRGLQQANNILASQVGSLQRRIVHLETIADPQRLNMQIVETKRDIHSDFDIQLRDIRQTALQIGQPQATGDGYRAKYQLPDTVRRIMPQGPGLGEQGFAATHRNTLAVENTTRSNKDIFGNDIPQAHVPQAEFPQTQFPQTQGPQGPQPQVPQIPEIRRTSPTPCPPLLDPPQPARPVQQRQLGKKPNRKPFLERQKKPSKFHPGEFSPDNSDDTEPDLYYGESDDDEGDVKIKREVKGEPSGGNPN